MCCSEVLDLEQPTPVWERTSTLNTGRLFHASCVVQNQYVYTFGGLDTNHNTLDSVERCGTSAWLQPDPKNKWELIQVDQAYHHLLKRYECGAFLLNEDEIILFGARDESEGGKDIVSFNLSNNQAQKKAQLSQSVDVSNSPVHYNKWNQLLTTLDYNSG